MKKLLLMSVLLFSISACAKMDVKVRPELERQYRPCKKELGNHYPGKYCWKQCTKYKLWHKHIPKNCKKWFIDVKDMNNIEWHNKSIERRYILIREDLLD